MRHANGRENCAREDRNEKDPAGAQKVALTAIEVGARERLWLRRKGERDFCVDRICLNIVSDGMEGIRP